MFDTDKTKKAYEELKESGLFDDDQLHVAKVFLQEDGWSGNVGLSPNKTGEMIGKDGKSIQNQCRNGRVMAYQTFQGFWLIPTEEIIRLRHKVLEG